MNDIFLYYFSLLLFKYSLNNKINFCCCSNCSGGLIIKDAYILADNVEVLSIYIYIYLYHQL